MITGKDVMMVIVGVVGIVGLVSIVAIVYRRPFMAEIQRGDFVARMETIDSVQANVK
jgi:hypothetical protein